MRKWFLNLPVYIRLAALYFILLPSLVFSQEEPDTFRFDINAFQVEGNTVLPNNLIQMALGKFPGKNKTTADVEEAREALEELYHKLGYPTVLVNIPEQTVEEGTVLLSVVESSIRKVKITGNRYHTMEKILRELESFQTGAILYVPKVQEELGRVNRNRDLNVSPVLAPGREPGTIDVELQVKDSLPLHGSLELSNRNTHDTSELRLNGNISYDNLWQKGHSLSLQYQMSPQKTSEVGVFAASYVMPAPWNQDHNIALYGVSSDSDTAFGEGFETLGKGNIFGMRLVMPLTPLEKFSHNVTIGIDYKDMFDENIWIEEKLYLTYLPLSVSYSGTLPDELGMTSFSGSVNAAFRGLVTDPDEFAIKRFRSRGNYLYATLGIERTQKLPYDFSLYVKLDGQKSNQPLPSNEQYSAGGMMSVRGYKESEILGDDAIHGIFELSAPNFIGLMEKTFFYSAANQEDGQTEDNVSFGSRYVMIPYFFYDYASLFTQDPLPGQERRDYISGWGAGFRGMLTRYFEYQLEAAFALEDTDRVKKGDPEIYFRVKGLF